MLSPCVTAQHISAWDEEAERNHKIHSTAERETAYRMRDPVDYDAGLALDELYTKRVLLAELAKGKDELAIGRLFMTVLEAEILNEEIDKAEREL